MDEESTWHELLEDTFLICGIYADAAISHRKPYLIDSVFELAGGKRPQDARYPRQA